MIGKTILHYKIIENSDQDGMDVVYTAEHTKAEYFVKICITSVST